MIFVSIGTSKPFDRLLRALGDLESGEPMFVQRGSSSMTLPGARVVDFMSFEEFVDAVRRARVVVTHAGVGSVLAVISMGKQPIVVPRLHAFGEAVDDHQLPFARRLHDSGLVVLVEDLSQLKDAIGAMAAARTSGATAGTTTAGALAADLRTFLGDEIGGPRSAAFAGAA